MRRINEWDSEEYIKRFEEGKKLLENGTPIAEIREHLVCMEMCYVKFIPTLKSISRYIYGNLTSSNWIVRLKRLNKVLISHSNLVPEDKYGKPIPYEALKMEKVFSSLIITITNHLLLLQMK